ncbi:amidase [Hoyosella sp. G463]|uniref:Amidase n=1 Tax=Lolliginicoccus lacisalsi TaxID=2742202 RepID=A0A927JB10_9ACTN|nr:amidase family protein [Lolliginicoccus lacisalsi]MBD8505974.1 amidase [Lolliginicoccus lacisalsi]
MTDLAHHETTAEHDAGDPAPSTTEWSATRIAAAIADGSISARGVLDQHIAVLDRSRSLNAIAADRFDDARRDADQIDTSTVPRRSPLLGVPFTVKEFIAVEGMPNTAGFPHRRRHRAQQDAPAIARLRAAGAIPLGVTNSAGPIFWMETYNPLYGRVSNPYDPTRTAGGSSGGDGAAVGCGGSPLSVGSDLGGSLRIPAFFNGVFAPLPSVGLVPTTGHYPMAHGEARRNLYLGPMARRATDLHAALAVMAGPDGDDPHSRLMPLHDPAHTDLAGMPVILAIDSTITKPGIELETARYLAANVLEARGAIVTETSLPTLRWALAQAFASFSSTLDIAGTVADILGRGHDGAVPALLHAPLAILRLAEVAPVRSARMLAARKLVSAAEKAADQITELLGDGAMLYPPFPRLAPKHFTTYGQPWLASNTVVFNMLGIPVTQVPTGLGSTGLPLGLQVAAAPGNDHVTIRVAQALEEGLGGWRPPRIP